MAYAKVGGIALMFAVLTGLTICALPFPDEDNPPSTDDGQKDVPKLVAKVYTLSDVILDSQDPGLGYRVTKVKNGGTMTLPHLVSDDPDKTFLGWSPYDDGHDLVLEPGSKLLVCEEIVVMYAIWEHKPATAVA